MRSLSGEYQFSEVSEVYSILTTRWRYLIVKGKGRAIQVVRVYLTAKMGFAHLPSLVFPVCGYLKSFGG